MVKVHIVDDVGVGVSPPGALKQKYILMFASSSVKLTFYVINYLETILPGLVSPLGAL